MPKNDQWNVNDIRTIMHNPVYVGLGPFPALVDEATWVAVQERAVVEDGAGPVLVQIRRALEETFGHAPDWMAQPGWLEQATAQCTQAGARVFFPKFLQALRDGYGQQ
jgi:hypothetical protein